MFNFYQPNKNMTTCFCLFTFRKTHTMALFLLLLLPQQLHAKNFTMVCFYTNWSQYRDPPARFVPEHVDPGLCTHVTYAFASIDESDFRIAMNQPNDDEMIARVNALKKIKPQLKTMLSIGGWSHDEKVMRYSRMVALHSRVKRFIETAISVLRKYKFDGLDIDWEYPGGRGSPASDRNRYTKFLQKLRAAFIDEARSSGQPMLLLSASVSASPRVIPSAYDAPEIAKVLDWINLMAYNLHGAWQDQTGCATAMQGPPPTVHDSLQTWLDQGMPAGKISLGLSAYGQTFQLSKPTENEFGAPTLGPGSAGRYTKKDGILANFEICLKQWSSFVDGTESGCGIPYSTHNRLWVSYESIQSIRTKVKELVVRKHLAGISFWSLDNDDFTGLFCNENVKFPLLYAANAELKVKPETEGECSRVCFVIFLVVTFLIYYIFNLLFIYRVYKIKIEI